MKKLTFILLTLFICFPPCTAHAQFRALLVGINYENADPDIPRLSGCLNDIRDMRDFMTRMQGIPAASIQTLTEEQATRRAILSRFRSWLMDGTEAGDTVFFQYSGHGYQLPDPFGVQQHDPVKRDKPEDLKFAEAFVPYDTLVHLENDTVENLILDSEIRVLLSELKDRKVHLFLDCCHSEGTSRDFRQIKAVSRYLETPWDPLKTRFVIPDDFPEQLRTAGIRGIRRNQAASPGDRPDYEFFAAARYFQKAYEYPINYGKNGAFTYSALQLLKANPGENFSNKEILDYARKQMHNGMGISEQTQYPVFHGPEGAESRPFVLLTQKTSPEPPPQPEPLPVPEPGKTAVRLTGENRDMIAELKKSIGNSDFSQINEDQPDVIADISGREAKMHNATGRLLKNIPLTSDGAENIMKSLESIHIIRELAALENPAAPFAVNLWIDEPGKTQFRLGERVTVFYRIDNFPSGKKAYLTLLNVAPDGTVSILYPQKADFHQGPGEKLYVNAEVIPGKVYSIPKTQADLKAGQHVAVDMRIRLEEGQEFFKAIVTTEPVDWESLNIGEFRSRFRRAQTKGFIVKLKQTLWAAASLRAEVRP